jgi:hypothetical protein
MKGIQYELLAAARDGDRERFDALFDAWVIAAYAAALRRTQGERDRAEAMTSAFLIGLVQNALDAVESDLPRESTNTLRKLAVVQ